MKAITDYLFNLRKFGKEPGVVRAGRALKYLGHPEKSLNIIHVAGTNGKGSVCSYITNTLIKLGFNVGMFTSPHLVKVNERIRMNGTMISDDDFMCYFNKVKEVSDKMSSEGFDGLAFFDFICVMAILYYADRKPDFVVLETGLGGRNDATAAITNKLMSVITSISFDHTEILGNTLQEIANEKAGIISEGSPVVYWKTNDEVAQIIEDVALKSNSLAIFVDKKSFQIHNLTRNRIDFSIDNRYYKNSMFSIKSSGMYQVMNATVALTALKVLNEELTSGKAINLAFPISNIKWDEQIVSEAVATTCWEGRMEEIEENIYLDGAHNPDGISSFLETARSLKQNGKMYLLFGAVCEKDYELMIKEICNSGCFDGYVITMINNHRALEIHTMAQEFAYYTDKPVYVEKDNKAAYDKAKALLNKGDILMCAGSLYLVGALKEVLGQ